MRSFTSLFLVCGLGGVASANAFAIAEQDATVTGRGNAAVATDSDPSAIFYNPAGIAIGSGINVEIGSSLVFANGTFTPFNTTDKSKTDSSPAVVPTVFGSYRINDLLAVGIGFSAPFGLAISWPDSSPVTDVAKEQSLRTYFISPVVAFNLGKYVPGLSIGGGIDIVPATVELKQNVFFGSTEGQAHLGATAVGVGGRIGAMYSPEALKQISVGAMWRSSVTEDFKGTGDFDVAQPFRSQLPPDGDISTSVTLPQAVTAGVAGRPIDNLELEVDVIWMNWEKFDTLTINAPGMTTITTPEKYKNTTSVRVGAEYRLVDQNLALRAGYIYDPTPVQKEYLTAQLPDADRNDITFGASYKMGNYAVNASGLVVLPVSRDTAMGGSTPVHQGTYDIAAFVASLSVSGRFGE